MKSRITRLAVAAVIIIAVLIAIHRRGGSIDGASAAWAAVSQRIVEADTAIFDVKVGEEGQDVPTIRCIQGKKGLRQKLQGGIDMIIDYEQGRFLILDSNRKTAMFIKLEGFPEAPANFFERLKWGMEKLKSTADTSVESLGTKKIDGRDAIGIRVRSGQSVDVTIWSEPERNLPLLITIDRMFGQTRAVFSNFDFDADIDESLFSMEVPDDYTLQEEAQMDLANPTEQDFIEGVRIWSNLMDGSFPSKLDLGLLREQAPAFDKKFKENQVPDAEQVKSMVQIVRGLTFVQGIKGDWHYAGNGVRASDGEQAIFWYQPEDSDSYRVVYGDLRVEEVAAEDLPN